MNGEMMLMILLVNSFRTPQTIRLRICSWSCHSSLPG